MSNPINSSGGRANEVLHHLCRVIGVSDADMARALDITRQSAHARRTKGATIPVDDLPAIAELLGVPLTLFFGLPIDAVQWLIDNRPELFGASPASKQGVASPVHYSAQNRCIAHSHRQVTRFNRRPLTLGNLTRSRRMENPATLNSNQLEVLLLRSGRRDTK